MPLYPVRLPVDTETGMSLKPGCEYFVTPSGGGPTLLARFNRAVCRCPDKTEPSHGVCETPVFEMTLGDEDIAILFTPGMTFAPTDATTERLTRKRNAIAESMLTPNAGPPPARLLALADLPEGSNWTDVAIQIIDRVTLVAERLVDLQTRVEKLGDVVHGLR